MKEKFFENKKVLLVGLGILGGGTSMAKFVLDQGGDLSVADLRDQDILQEEAAKINSHAEKLNKKVEYFFGPHTKEIFDNSDVVVFNPAVPYFSAWPTYCRDNKIKLYNDMTLFQDYLNFKYKKDLSKKPKQIWVSGTRGKSTTTTFIHHLLGEKAVIGGNVPGAGLQKISDKKCDFFVLETSNYQLEYEIQNNDVVEPTASVLTNIFIDHINRHKTVEEYRRVKKNIFKYNKGAKLFINKNEKSLEDIWKEKHHANISFINNFGKDFSDLKNKYKYFSDNQIVSLATAITVSKFFNVSEKDITKRIKTIEIPKMRQEVVFENKKFKIINDSTATNPDALVAAIQNYPDAYFISGGTDAELDFTNLIKEIQKAKFVKNNKIFLLQGTATEKIAQAISLPKENIVQDFETVLNKIFEQIKKEKISGKTTIILSPGAKSFGLFKNEYDRGEKFNKVAKKLFK
jgi:UDP-N-acetylmuramoylalanine--D-glutamate ligase